MTVATLTKKHKTRNERSAEYWRGAAHEGDEFESAPADPPHVALAKAVIAQALRDLFGDLSTTKPRTTPPRGAQVKARNEAMAFLTDGHGEWARSRCEWCEAGGLDPDELRAQVLRKLTA